MAKATKAPRAPKPPKPRKKTALEKSCDRIAKRGGVVILHHGPQGGKATYQLQDGGEVAAATFHKLLAAGMLRANGDGLLEGMDQSFHTIKTGE